MVRKNENPGESIVDNDLNLYRNRAEQLRIYKLSVRWGGAGAPFKFVGELYGGMKGYGLLLEDDPEFNHVPHPNHFNYSEHLRGVHWAGDVYPDLATTHADFNVVGYNTEMILAPYNREGHPCDFKIHRAQAQSAEEDIGEGFGKAGDFCRIGAATMDKSSAADPGLTPEEYARNYWELAIIPKDLYNGYLADWNWFDRSQGANSSHFDPPLP